MKELILAAATGFIVGLVFSFLKLPLPAPNVLPGVLGIIGIYLGGQFFKYVAPMLSNLHK